jgi:hypothetical protein
MQPEQPEDPLKDATTIYVGNLYVVAPSLLPHAEPPYELLT